MKSKADAPGPPGDGAAAGRGVTPTPPELGVELPHPDSLLAEPAAASAGSAGEDLMGPVVVRDGLVPVEHTVLDDRSWHFSIALPPEVEVIGRPAVAPSLAAPTQSLGLFRRHDPEADVEVLGHLLEYEIDAHDWLERTLRAEGRRIRSSKPKRLLSGAMGDIVATWALDDEHFAGRYIATKWGPRLFIACARTRLADYPALADELFRSAASLEALDRSSGAFGEPVHFFFEDVPCEWKVAVPDSWSIQHHAPSEEGAWFDAMHTAPGPVDEMSGEVDGRLSVAVMARSVAQRPRDAGNVLLRALRDNDVHLEHATFERDDDTLPVCRTTFLQAWSLVTPLRRGEAEGELRCRVMMHEHAWVVAGVLGSTREEDEDAWMRNKRVLDVVSCTLELAPDESD